MTAMMAHARAARILAEAFEAQIGDDGHATTRSSVIANIANAYHVAADRMDAEVLKDIDIP